MGHMALQYMLILRAYPSPWASPFSEEICVEAVRRWHLQFGLEIMMAGA